MKTELASLTYDELSREFSGNGLPAFRAGQVYKWISRGIFSFDEMTDLSKQLRTDLSEKYDLPYLKEVKKQISSDGTVKYLFALRDGEMIETVVMKYNHGNSVCISSQVGCRMNCAFCASSLKGLTRNLSSGEMLAQVLYANREYGVDSIVIMGIGEPLDNFDNLIVFLKNISDQRGLGLSHRHISVSTCGLVPRIYELADMKLQITLSVSLHAPDDVTRSGIMPVNKKWNVGELIKACEYYFKMTGRRISFEYTLIKGVNDTPEKARILASLLKNMPAHVNLIPVNYVSERGLHPTSKDGVRSFQEYLMKLGVNATVRRTLGEDIDGACGQLRHSAEGKR